MINIDPVPDDELCEQIAEALVHQGYIVLVQPLDAAITEGILAHLNTLVLIQAGIGRAKGFQVNTAIRGDQIHWLEPGVPAIDAFLLWMDQLRAGLNERLFSSLVKYESHYATYDAGAGYQKHLDAFKDQPARKISTVLYLNKQWPEDAGGELLLYDETGTEILQKIAPEYGTLVIFLSERFPHEVRPGKKKRHSIAGWFRIQSV